jgi:uncharacterized protein (TIGR02145 family)
MKKSIMFTLGLAALFCAACVDNSTNGSGGGAVDALSEKYNNPNGGNGGGGGGGGGGGASFMLTTNVNPENGGDVTRNPNSTIYNEGTKVTLTAVPKDGYTFKNWTGALNSNNASIEITMDDVKILTANFQKVYESVQIGRQVWMSKNLNEYVEGSRCYGDVPANCDKYGRLYDWYTARTICPVGWHLPSDAEWTTLENQVGGQATAGKKLKSKSGWETWWDSNGNEVSGNGTDEYGFAALPGGYGSSDGNFDAAGYDGYWWSSSDNDSYVWYRYMDFHSEYLEIRDGNKASLRSVRCVMD